ncbi:HigA protein (antitoxin to HigB) [uncultured Candidatus Thioglobus sp.]|nr:HigA protein (antitoxin to HigB) [uncultured Candidatus Thioglobus sp.]
MSDMHRPAHPGELLKNGWIDELNISVTSAAKNLGLSRKHLSNIINQKAGVSADVSMRLGKWTGVSSQLWLDMQSAWDLWQLRDIDYAINKLNHQQTMHL